MDALKRDRDRRGLDASASEIPNSNDQTSTRNGTAAQAILIGEFDATSREVARVTLETYKGHDLVCVRKWFENRDGEMRPAKGGISLNVKHLPRLVELMGAAHLAAMNAGLIGGGAP
jgi:hypothetical protein